MRRHPNADRRLIMKQATKRYNRIAQYMPRTGEALSPRNAPPAIRASDARAYDRSDNPTAGRNGSGDGRRRTRNTMANARMGGRKVHYFEPAELDTVPRPNVQAPPRIAPQHALETHAKTLAAAEFAGHRDRAMQRHSILTTNGAVDVQPRTGPVWLSDSPNI